MLFILHWVLRQAPVLFQNGAFSPVWVWFWRISAPTATPRLHFFPVPTSALNFSMSSSTRPHVGCGEKPFSQSNRVAGIEIMIPCARARVCSPGGPAKQEGTCTSCRILYLSLSQISVTTIKQPIWHPTSAAAKLKGGGGVSHTRGESRRLTALVFNVITRQSIIEGHSVWH